MTDDIKYEITIWFPDGHRSEFKVADFKIVPGGVAFFVNGSVRQYINLGFSVEAL